MSKKLSIIIPVYNGEKFIGRCLQSIFLQNFKDYEIIIINDGSTDRTEEMIKKIIEENKTKKIVYQYQKNQGVAVARNRGIELASSKYVMFIDHDDYIEKDFLSNLYTYALENNIDLLRSGYKLVDQDEKIIKEVSYSSENIIFRKKNYHLFLDTTSFGYVGGLFIKREIISDIRFDSSLKFAEDLDFILKCYSRANTMAYYAQSGYFYFQNDLSATKNKNIAIRIKEIEDNIEVFSKFEHYHIEKPKIANTLYIRINMKLKYIIQNCDISYQELKKVMKKVQHNQHFIYYKDKYNLSSINVSYKDKYLIKLLVRKRYGAYYFLNKFYKIFKLVFN